jgi:hypothetical protein
MPTPEQHEWTERVFGIKLNRDASSAPENTDSGILNTVASTVADAAATAAATVGNAASTYADFSIGEVEGAANVIMPMAEQAAAIAPDLNPAQALSDGLQATYKLATDEEYRDAAGAKAEAFGKTALNVAEVAGEVAQTTNQITTDLAGNPVKGIQELASVAGAGAEKLGQAYDRAAAAYDDAAAKGEGAEFVGKAVGAVGAMVGLAAVGDPEAAGGELLTDGLAATADAESVTAGAELPALAQDAGAETGALSDAGQLERPASVDAAPEDLSGDVERHSRGLSPRPDDEPTVTDGVAPDPATQSGEAIVEDESSVRTQEGAAIDDARSGEAVADDESRVTTQEGAAADDATSGEALADGDSSVQTQEGAAADDATKELEGPPANIDEVVAGASGKVQAMTDEDLAALTNDEKNQLVKDLTCGGKPSGDAQDSLCKVYRSMKPDPAFTIKDDVRMRDAAASLADDADLKAAKENWGGLGMEERVDALKKVVGAQSKAYGVEPPEIGTYVAKKLEGGLVENGKFNGKQILLNSDPDNPALQDFDRAIDLVTHENAHAYQKELVERLQRGELRPGDEDYEQAAMFAVNDRPGAYIEAEETTFADYGMQPMEQHAFHTGSLFSNVIADAL